MTVAAHLVLNIVRLRLVVTLSRGGVCGTQAGGGGGGADGGASMCVEGDSGGR